MKNYPLTRKNEIVIQETANEILIYDLKKNKAYCLNPTSALIWQECDGKKSVAQISMDLSKKSKTPISENIVWLALSQLDSEELLENRSELINPLEGLSRREIVKRVGFASIVALPMISSLVAPTAVNAQSGSNCFAPAGQDARTSGCPCQSNNDCCSNCSAGFCNPPLLITQCGAAASCPAAPCDPFPCPPASTGVCDNP